MAALLAAISLPVTAAGPALGKTGGNISRPPRLKQGDVIGLVEPASASDEPFQLELAEEAIVTLGFKPKRGKHLLERDGYLAGTDKNRAADVNAMFADPQVKAIFAVRGGWGAARILPYLDWPMIAANPKLLMGFSDITALHMAIAAKAGFPSLHGPNATSSWASTSLDSFRQLAMAGETPTLNNPLATEDRLVQRRWRTQTITAGKARGKLLGGNLTVLNALTGTPYLPDFDGAILFLEDVDEAEYRIDRMLTQLGQSGVLAKISGFVFGQCTDCQASGRGVYGGFPLSAVLDHHIAPLGIPAYSGAYFGHISDQFCMPVGIEAEMDAEAGSIRILEPLVR